MKAYSMGYCAARKFPRVAYRLVAVDVDLEEQVLVVDLVGANGQSIVVVESFGCAAAEFYPVYQCKVVGLSRWSATLNDIIDIKVHPQENQNGVQLVRLWFIVKDATMADSEDTIWHGSDQNVFIVNYSNALDEMSMRDALECCVEIRQGGFRFVIGQS